MEYLIIVSIVLFSVVGMWAVNQVGRKKNLTISQHVAQSQTAQIVFGIIGLTATLLHRGQYLDGYYRIIKQAFYLTYYSA